MCAISLAAGCGAETDSSSAAPQVPAGVKCSGARTASSSGWTEPLQSDIEPQLPVTYLDNSATEITITDTSRILALDTYGTLGTTVHALGLGDQLVGRDVSTGVPDLAELPVVTHNGHQLAAEAILNLNPSVILTDYSIGPLEVQMQLRDAGIPVVIMDDQRSRDAIGDQIRAVAEVLGVAERGTILAERVEAEIAEAEAEVAELAPKDEADKVRMVFLYMRGNAGVFYWFGEGSGADDLIEALGGIDVASETGLAGTRPLNAEGLIKSAPDLYLMMSDGLSSVGGVDGLADVPGVAETNAGIHQCTVDMSDAEILSFGPQFPHTLRSLGHAIYDDQASASQ